MSPEEDQAVVRPIRQGYLAELKFVKLYRPMAAELAQTVYHISSKQVDGLVSRALKAATYTIRQYHWHSQLLHQAVLSQVLVLRWKQGRITQKDAEDIRQTIERYLRKHLLTSDVEHERLRDATLDIFMKRVRTPGFRLTSTLDTYVIGILRNQIREFYNRPEKNQRPPSGVSSQQLQSNPQLADELAEKFRFYRTSHRIIAQHLDRLGRTCRELLLLHYCIDPARIYAVNDMQETSLPETNEALRTQFNVADESVKKTPTLKELAPLLSISPKQISDRHVDCLDRLVQQVATFLLRRPDSAFVRVAKKELQNRLDKAEIRQTKRQHGKRKPRA